MSTTTLDAWEARQAELDAETAARKLTEQIFDKARAHIDLWHNRRGQCKLAGLTGRCPLNGGTPRKSVS